LIDKKKKIFTILVCLKGGNMRDIDKELLNACRIGDLEKVKQLLESGADVNVKDDEFGCTPLILASCNGHKEVVELLLDNGADVDARDKYGFCMIPFTLEKDGKEALKELEKNVHINGWTALMYASQKGYAEIVKLLIEKGANVNAKDDRGFTALMLASQNGHKEIVELLKSYGARE
jgi:ankyrin repeat protein